MRYQYTRGIGMEDEEAILDCVHLQNVGCIGDLMEMWLSLSRGEHRSLLPSCDGLLAIHCIPKAWGAPSMVHPFNTENSSYF